MDCCKSNPSVLLIGAALDRSGSFVFIPSPFTILAVSMLEKAVTARSADGMVDIRTAPGASRTGRGRRVRLPL